MAILKRKVDLDMVAWVEWVAWAAAWAALALAIFRSPKNYR